MSVTGRRAGLTHPEGGRGLRGVGVMLSVVPGASPVPVKAAMSVAVPVTIATVYIAARPSVRNM